MRCPNCGTENVPGAPACARCNTPLAGPPQEGAPEWAPPPQGPGEWGAPGAPPPGPHPSGDWVPPGQPAPPVDQWGRPVAPQPSGEWGQPGAAPPGAPQAAWGQPGGPPSGGGWAPAGPGYGTGGYPGQVPRKDSTRRNLLVALGILLVVAVGAAAFIMAGSGDDETASDEVVLEPIGSVQQDDFAGNLDAEDLGSSLSQAVTATPALSDEPASASLVGGVADGTEPGLYGGSRDAAVCDVDQLVAFLSDPANAAQAEAWAGTLGITVADIPTYVDGLTAVRLRFDTRVTNHGFTDGEANPFQSLLQAGTAVLVDDTGVPRVKCNCGNPLAEPTDAGGGGGSIEDVAQNPDDAWEGLNTASVVEVVPGAQTNGFTIVDNADGALFERPSGSNGDADAALTDFGALCDTFEESPTCGGNIDLGGGDMQITLTWTSSADLDLHVTEPDGNEIYFANRGPSGAGGELDVDSNVGCDPQGSVENVFWSSPPPAGEYTIGVTGYSVGEAAGADCGGGDYELTIRVEGQEDRVETGTVGDDETDTFSVSR